MYGAGQLFGVIVRTLLVMLLVYGTYNPGGYSYYHWITQGGSDMLASKLCVGLVIVLGFIISINATVRSLGRLLLPPGIALVAALIWMLSSWGWIDLADSVQRTLVAEGAVVAVLGAGLPFSQIRFRLAGQKDSRTISNPPLFG
jgi:hypothetical protein